MDSSCFGHPVDGDDWDRDGETHDLDTDDFEMEMRDELRRRAEKAERESGLEHESFESDPAQSVDGAAGATKTYDDVYFDSDDDENDDIRVSEAGASNSSNFGRTVLSNDDLLYDPESDDRDQQWVDKIRSQYVPKDARRIEAQKKSRSVKAAPNSDAVLNCPACFTLLCLDCQRHEVYEHQYRAMFVLNCSVNMAETLKYPLPKSARKKQKRDQASSDAQWEEIYHPVKCDSCSTEVAVYDKDEVYHFFNIVASYA